MERKSIRITSRQESELQELVDRGYYNDQSEAIRTAVNGLLDSHANALRERPPRHTIDWNTIAEADD